LRNSRPDGKVRPTPRRRYYDLKSITGKRASGDRNDSANPSKPAKSKTRTEEPESDKAKGGTRENKEEDDDDKFNPARWGHDGDRLERFTR
jgi:hypothetical protein